MKQLTITKNYDASAVITKKFFTYKNVEKIPQHKKELTVGGQVKIFTVPTRIKLDIEIYANSISELEEIQAYYEDESVEYFIVDIGETIPFANDTEIKCVMASQPKIQKTLPPSAQKFLVAVTLEELLYV